MMMTRDELDDQIGQVVVMLVPMFEASPIDEAMQNVERNLTAIRAVAEPPDLEWMESRIGEVLELALAISDEYGYGKGSE